MEKQKVLLLFSGGFDSVVLLNDLIRQNFDVYLLFFNYGQKPLAIEEKHAMYWVQKFGLELKSYGHTIPQFNWSQSSMFHHGDLFNEEKENDYIELRNLIFFSYASSMAQSKQIPTIASAILDGSFVDATPQFCKAFDSLIFSTANIDLMAPYMYWNKEQLGEYAVKELKLDMKELIENSITCNIAVKEPCGECIGCKQIEDFRRKYVK